MRCAKGITLEVGQTVDFHTWDETDPANPIRHNASGVITELAGESPRNQTLGEVTIKTSSGSVTLPAGAVTVVPSTAPAPAPAPAKRKHASRKSK